LGCVSGLSSAHIVWERSSTMTANSLHLVANVWAAGAASAECRSLGGRVAVQTVSMVAAAAARLTALLPSFGGGLCWVAFTAGHDLAVAGLEPEPLLPRGVLVDLELGGHARVLQCSERVGRKISALRGAVSVARGGGRFSCRVAVVYGGTGDTSACFCLSSLLGSLRLGGAGPLLACIECGHRACVLSRCGLDWPTLSRSAGAL
jgi:hypothetical protein